MGPSVYIFWVVQCWGYTNYEILKTHIQGNPMYIIIIYRLQTTGCAHVVLTIPVNSKSSDPQVLFWNLPPKMDE